MKQNRVEKVLKNMEARGLTQLIVSDPTSVLYLTGLFTEPGERMYALYLRADGDHKFFVNDLFYVPEDIGVERVHFSDTDDPGEILCRYVDMTKPLGVDKTFEARFLMPVILKHGAEGISVASECVDAARAVKDAEERALMREASRINDAAMGRFRALLREGITEEELAGQMLGIYRELGAQDYSFPPIVGFGRNSAVSHHTPDKTPLRAGDTVLFDVGCKKDWYCSDMTRLFFFKREPDAEERKIYDTVRRAVAAAEAACRPGALLCDIDGAARAVIADAGYGPNFVHRTGHFIGLEDHDFGDVSRTNTNRAVPGNVFSIEPSILMPGRFTFYIEDLALITEDGAEILNHYPHDIDVVW